MDRSTERSRIGHLVNSLSRIGNALTGTRGPSVAKGPQKRSIDAGHNEAATDIAGASVNKNAILNTVAADSSQTATVTAPEDCADPHATPLSHIDDPHDLPLVSLGQGTSRVDYFEQPSPPVKLAPGVQRLYTAARSLAAITLGKAEHLYSALSARVCYRVEPAEPATATYPGRDRTVVVDRIYLSQEISEEILTNFVRLSLAKGYTPGQIEPLLEIVHESITGLSLPNMEEDEARIVADLELIDDSMRRGTAE